LFYSWETGRVEVTLEVAGDKRTEFDNKTKYEAKLRSMGGSMGW
jgi:hypothetical protein